VLAAFLDRLETFFAALGTFGSTFYEFGTNQLEHGLLGAITLARAQSNNARIASVALPEASPQLVEKLLHGNGRTQESRGLAPSVQRVLLRESDHLFDQRLSGFSLGNCGDYTLFLDNAGH